jgi:hypothetical protein
MVLFISKQYIMHVGKKGDILTTVRLQDELFEDFKQEAIRSKITMRNLLERSMFLFMTNPEFKKIITNQLHANYKRPI